MSETMRSGTSHDHWQLPECPTQPPTVAVDIPRSSAENWALGIWARSPDLTDACRAGLEDEAAGRTIDGYRAANAELADQLRAVRQTLADVALTVETVADELDPDTDEWVGYGNGTLAMMLRACLPVADDRDGLGR